MLNSLYCNYPGVACRFLSRECNTTVFLGVIIYSSLRRNCADLLPWYIQHPDVVPILMPGPGASTSTCMSDDPRHSMVVRLPNRPVSVRIKARPYLEQVRFSPPPKHSSSLSISHSAFIRAIEKATVPPPASCLLPSTINHNHCIWAPSMTQAEPLANGSRRSCLDNGMKPLLCTLRHVLGFHPHVIPQSLKALCSSMSSLSAFPYLVSILLDILSLCCYCHLAFYRCCTYSA